MAIYELSPDIFVETFVGSAKEYARYHVDTFHYIPYMYLRKKFIGTIGDGHMRD